MAYTSKQIAQEFITLGEGRMSQIQLQKMVFFAHGIYLALTNGQPLVKEQFKAWAYGPVLPSLYQDLKCYGSGPVTSVNHPLIAAFAPIPKPVPEEVKGFLAKIFQTYGHLSAGQMVHLTHAQDGPWKEVYDSGQDCPISNETIKNYFAKVLSQHAA